MTLVFYAPSISGNAYLVWKLLFSSDSYGWINAWLMKLGITQEAIYWLETEDYIMPIMIIVQLWLSLRRFSKSGPVAVCSGRSGRREKQMAGAVVYYPALHETAANVRRGHADHKFAVGISALHRSGGISFRQLCGAYHTDTSARLWKCPV